VKHLGKERQHQELPARVEECVHKKVEEHIHPVIYKETLKPTVLEETHHVYETVKERPVETYEVRDVIHHDKGKRMTEREFFDEYSHKGISMQEREAVECHRDLKEGKHIHKDAALVDAGHVHTHEHQHEQLIGHHQNIGAHHAPAGAVPIGHNTAYDAALCDTCTGHKAGEGHSKKDHAMMKEKEKEKKKEEKIEDKKEAKKHEVKESKDKKSYKEYNVV